MLLQSVPFASSRLVRARPLRRAALLLVLALFVALTVAVVVGSPLDTVDRDALHWQLAERWPALRPFVLTYVMIGQRGPSTAVALPFLAWLAWRRRSPRPLIRFGLALVLLNVLVGAVKVTTGRLGPQLTSHPTAVFDGGNIYPSGHVANVVLLFGVLTWTATTHRRYAIVATAFVTLTVGAGTVYLDTHWVTDVIGGILAGAIVLLLLPTVLPPTERLIERTWRRLRSPELRAAPDRAGQRAADLLRLPQPIGHLAR